MQSHSVGHPIRTLPTNYSPWSTKLWQLESNNRRLFGLRFIIHRQINPVNDLTQGGMRGHKAASMTNSERIALRVNRSWSPFKEKSNQCHNTKRGRAYKAIPQSQNCALGQILSAALLGMVLALGTFVTAFFRQRIARQGDQAGW
jgi:hypothetical protein